MTSEANVSVIANTGQNRLDKGVIVAAYQIAQVVVVACIGTMRGNHVVEELGNILCGLEHAVGELNGGQNSTGRKRSRAFLYST